MLQKELNHQQEQPGKEKEKKLLDKSISAAKPTVELAPQRRHSGWERGVILAPSSPPLVFSRSPCNNQLQIRNITGTGSVARDYPSFSPVQSRASEGLETDSIARSRFMPEPARVQQPPGSDVLEHSRLPQATRLCLCTHCLSYSESPSPSSLGRRGCTVSSGDTSRKSTGIPQSADASPLCARHPGHAVVFTH